MGLTAIAPAAERPDEVRQKHETLATGPVRHRVEPGVELRFFRYDAGGARNRRDHDGEQAQASLACWRPTRPTLTALLARPGQ